MADEAASKLPGDLLGHALGDLEAGDELFGDPLPDRERVSPSLDPQTIAELLAYDIPFTVEPATAFVFPAGVDRG